MATSVIHRGHSLDGCGLWKNSQSEQSYLFFSSLMSELKPIKPIKIKLNLLKYLVVWISVKILSHFPMRAQSMSPMKKKGGFEMQ